MNESEKAALEAWLREAPEDEIAERLWLEWAQEDPDKMQELIDELDKALKNKNNGHVIGE
jgi:hypothetical protein